MIIQAKPETVRYTLGMSKPHTHFFEVAITIDNLSRSEAHIDFIMPVWRPGRYVVLDLAGGVQEFSAQDGNGK